MKTLSLVVPVFNEQKRLKKTFYALNKFSPPRTLHLIEILFINDGSTDASIIMLKNYIKRFEKKNKRKIVYKILSYIPNRGKGYAVRQGMLSATADYALFFDTDLSTPLSEIKKFAPSMNHGTQVIIGTRKHKKSSVLKHQPLLRETLGSGFTKLANILLHDTITDYTCGFKAFSKHARFLLFSHNRINRWGFDAEILYLAGHRYNLTITEIPVVWRNDAQTKVNLWHDIPLCLSELLKIVYFHRFLPTLSLTIKSNYSHKAYKS